MRWGGWFLPCVSVRVSLVVDFKKAQDFQRFRASGMMRRLVGVLFATGPLSCATCPGHGTSDKHLRRNEM
jgi:hypothetical protein